jgi:hypothetical protein
VLVSNAGIASAGVTEAFTTEQAKAIFDTMSSGCFASPAPCSSMQQAALMA